MRSVSRKRKEGRVGDQSKLWQRHFLSPFKIAFSSDEADDDFNVTIRSLQIDGNVIKKCRILTILIQIFSTESASIPGFCLSKRQLGTNREG